MNPWIIDFCYFVLLLCFVIGGIASVVLLIGRKRKKKSIKSTVISLVIGIFLLAVLILFIASHSTYYKYNDWTILQSNIRVVQQKYGDFDLGTIRDNQAGKVIGNIYCGSREFAECDPHNDCSWKLLEKGYWSRRYKGEWRKWKSE